MTTHVLPRLRSLFSARLSTRAIATHALAVCAFLTISAGLSAPAQAQWVSTKELVDTYCANEDPEQSAFCVGYVAGALHVLMAPPQMLPRGKFCIEIDKQPKLTAIAERLIKLRNEQPDLEPTPAFTVIAAIIERGFPCPEEVLEATDTPTPQQPAEPSDLFGLPAEE